MGWSLGCDGTASTAQQRGHAAAHTAAQSVDSPCDCGPPPPIAPPRRCADGGEEGIDVSCREADGRCAWQVTRTGCPQRCPEQDCGPLPEEAQTRCPNAITRTHHAACMGPEDGACAWRLIPQDCAQRPPCSSSAHCEADQYCDEESLCALRPITCAPVKGQAERVCAANGARYPSACLAAMAGEAVSADPERCAALDAAERPERSDKTPQRSPKRPKLGKLCKDVVRCGAPPPIAPPQRCEDGSEAGVAVRCEQRDRATCSWQVYREDCP